MRKISAYLRNRPAGATHERPRLAAVFLMPVVMLTFFDIQCPRDVEPGIDLFQTPGRGSSYSDFSENPLPPEFFREGSDPFEGKITFVGVPLDRPGGPLLTTDTIVERLQRASLRGSPSEATAEIIIRALRLKSE